MVTLPISEQAWRGGAPFLAQLGCENRHDSGPRRSTGTQSQAWRNALKSNWPPTVFSQAIVAVDGSKFKAVNSPDRC